MREGGKKIGKIGKRQINKHNRWQKRQRVPTISMAAILVRGNVAAPLHPLRIYAAFCFFFFFFFHRSFDNGTRRISTELHSSVDRFEWIASKVFRMPAKIEYPGVRFGRVGSFARLHIALRARARMHVAGWIEVRSLVHSAPSLPFLPSFLFLLPSLLSFFFFFFSFEIVVIVAVFVGFAVTQGQNPREKNTIGNRVDVVTERKVERKREREREKGRKEYRNPNGGYSRSTRKVLITSLHGPLEDASWKVESQPGPGSFDLPRNCAHYLSNLISRSACYSFNEFLIRSRH